MHVGQGQPITGIPVDVPVPRRITFKSTASVLIRVVLSPDTQPQSLYCFADSGTHENGIDGKTAEALRQDGKLGFGRMVSVEDDDIFTVYRAASTAKMAFFPPHVESQLTEGFFQRADDVFRLHAR